MKCFDIHEGRGTYCVGSEANRCAHFQSWYHVLELQYHSQIIFEVFPQPLHVLILKRKHNEFTGERFQDCTELAKVTYFTRAGKPLINTHRTIEVLLPKNMIFPSRWKRNPKDATPEALRLSHHLYSATYHDFGQSFYGHIWLFSYAFFDFGFKTCDDIRETFRPCN